MDPILYSLESGLAPAELVVSDILERLEPEREAA